MSLVVRSLQKTVTTAGTAEALSSTSLRVKKAWIRPLAGNTNPVFIGNDGADDVTSSNGLVLEPADPALELGDVESGGVDQKVELSSVIVDVTTNGEGVSVLYLIEE